MPTDKLPCIKHHQNAHVYPSLDELSTKQSAHVIYRKKKRKKYYPDASLYMQPARHKYLYIRAIMRFQLDNWLPMTSFAMAEAALMSASGEPLRYRDAITAPTMGSCPGGRAHSIAALHYLVREALEIPSLFIAGKCLVHCSGRAALHRALSGPSLWFS